MLCPNCNEEVLLAEICPYCGKAVPQESHEQAGPNEETGKGTFVGPMNSSEASRNEGAQEPRFNQRGDRASKPKFFSFLRYFFDPTVPASRKLAMVGMLIYILSPLDLVPEILPIFGWMDDIAVGTLLWTFINYELAKYRGPKI